MRKILGTLLSRMVVIGVLIAVQVLILILFILRLTNYFVVLYGVLVAISMVVTLWIVNKEDNPSYKLAWIVPILLFPLFGGLFYLMFGSGYGHGHMLRKLEHMYERQKDLFFREFSREEHKQIDDMDAYAQSKYLVDQSGFPVYQNTDTLYLSPGEVKFEELKKELKKARRFIFLEYFIIQEGVMWNGILEILKEKAAEGLDVRVIYDDVGCLNTLPTGYWKTLQNMGIRCQVFNRFRPVMSVVMNNRDHRKIAVIDGMVGFVGGINLADEYINAIVKHGYWKDSAVKLSGEAVWSLTVMFLQLWCAISGEQENAEDFRADPAQIAEISGEGFVQPYSDAPIDDERVGEMVYLNMISRARRYIYMCSPYLIIDHELVTSMILAAKSGVDVRIITPHIGDKWYVHSVTRAYYAELIRGGVKIYEYEPGFIHSKTFVCDDELATVGTINLDYRSLYLHFECGVWMYRASAVGQVKKDFVDTLGKCIPITLDSKLMKVSLPQRIVRALLRLFAPLM